MSILDRIVATKRAEVRALAGSADGLRARALAAPPARPFGDALRRAGRVALIAEVKRRSPSAGWIREGAEPVEVARTYEAAGAAALSVLTDREYFGGSLADLEAVRGAVSLPVLRKDFVIDPVQVWEARAAGADAVLLIARVLGDDELRGLLELAETLGLGALVEVHTPAELERTLAAGAAVVGVNNRDLATFRTDLVLTVELAGRVPPERVLVAESGIRTAADVDRLGEAGVDAVLVGESLMRADDVGAATAALVGRPRVSRG